MKIYHITLLTIIFSLMSCNGSAGKTEKKVKPTNYSEIQNKLEKEHKEDEGHEEENEISLNSNAIRLINLKISTVQKKSIYSKIKLTGEIVANRDTIQHIYPKYSGLVTRIHAYLGDKVSRGQALTTIQNKETLTYYNVSSLLYGTVIGKNISLGQVVSDDQEIFTIANLRDVWAEFDIYTKDILDIKKGQAIKIQSAGLKQSIKAKISYISPVINPITRSKTARVVLLNKTKTWLPGMFVNGTIQVAQEETVLAVPNDAIQILNEEKVVFVSEDKNTFYSVEVTTGKSDEYFTQILSGLQSGQEVVTKGAFELKAKIMSSSFGGHNH